MIPRKLASARNLSSVVIRRASFLEIEQIGFSDLTINKRCNCDRSSPPVDRLLRFQWTIHPRSSFLLFRERRIDKLSNSIGRLGRVRPVFSQSGEFLTMSERFPDFRAAEFDFNHSSRLNPKRFLFPVRSNRHIAANDTVARKMRAFAARQ